MPLRIFEVNTMEDLPENVNFYLYFFKKYQNGLFSLDL